MGKGDRSHSKVLIVQEWSPKFNAENPHIKKPDIQTKGPARAVTNLPYSYWNLETELSYKQKIQVN